VPYLLVLDYSLLPVDIWRRIPHGTLLQPHSRTGPALLPFLFGQNIWPEQGRSFLVLALQVPLPTEVQPHKLKDIVSKTHPILLIFLLTIIVPIIVSLAL
jgi:hypothetical protein